MASEAELTRISERLKAARAMLQHSQAAMAPILGLSMTQLKRLEVGANVPSGETLLKYRELGFNPSWILTGEGSMQVQPQQDPDATLMPPVIRAPDLLAMILEAVEHSCDTAGVTLSAFQRGHLIAEKYNDILACIPDPEDWRGAVLMMAAQLRKEIAPPTRPSGT